MNWRQNLKNRKEAELEEQLLQPATTALSCFD